MIHIILDHTSHPGNIGGAARAMKNMGLSELRLVAPKDYPSVEATRRASGADDILARAKQFKSLEEALADMTLVFGTSARKRHLPWPLINPREMSEKICAQENNHIAIVFGNEQSGLSNEALALCQYHVNIPTEESFSSLNLAAAVQVLCYEIKMASLSNQDAISAEPELNIATVSEVSGLLSHLQESMVDVGFLNTQQPKRLTQRLQRLLAKARLEKEEVNILRGYLSAVDKLIK